MLRSGATRYELRADPGALDEDDSIPVGWFVDGKPAGRGDWCFVDGEVSGEAKVPPKIIAALLARLRKTWSSKYMCRVWSLDVRGRATSNDVARWGGAPFGVASEDWPRDSLDRRMLHVLTLDVRSLELPVPSKTAALAYFEEIGESDGEPPYGVVVRVREEHLKRGPTPIPKGSRAGVAMKLRLLEEDRAISSLGTSYVGGVPTDRNGISAGRPKKFLFQLNRDDVVTHVFATQVYRARALKRDSISKRKSRPKSRATTYDLAAHLAEQLQIMRDTPILALGVPEVHVANVRNAGFQIDEDVRRETYDWALIYGLDSHVHLNKALGAIRTGAVVAWREGPLRSWYSNASLDHVAAWLGLSVNANAGDGAERSWDPILFRRRLVPKAEVTRVIQFFKIGPQQTVGVFGTVRHELSVIMQGAAASTRVRSEMRPGNEPLDSFVYKIWRLSDELRPPAAGSHEWLRDRNREFKSCCKRLRPGGTAWIVFPDPGPMVSEIKKFCRAQGLILSGSKLSYTGGRDAQSALRFRRASVP